MEWFEVGGSLAVCGLVLERTAERSFGLLGVILFFY